jgi:hypothetical protein
VIVGKGVHRHVPPAALAMEQDHRPYLRRSLHQLQRRRRARRGRPGGRCSGRQRRRADRCSPRNSAKVLSLVPEPFPGGCRSVQRAFDPVRGRFGREDACFILFPDGRRKARQPMTLRAPSSPRLRPRSNRRTRSSTGCRRGRTRSPRPSDGRERPRASGQRIHPGRVLRRTFQRSLRPRETVPSLVRGALHPLGAGRGRFERRIPLLFAPASRVGSSMTLVLRSDVPLAGARWGSEDHRRADTNLLRRARFEAGRPGSRSATAAVAATTRRTTAPTTAHRCRSRLAGASSSSEARRELRPASRVASSTRAHDTDRPTPAHGGGARG